MAKKTIVGKRKFEFRTPQKHASPFVFKRKRHQVENDDNDKNERIKRMQVHDNELRQKYFKSHEATNNPHAEIFDALCAIVERTIDHTASSTTSSGETNKQLLHVLDAAAVIIKTEFASAATSNTDMHFLESSLYEVERMVHVSDALRSALFDAFHASEFQGYQHMQSPKDAIKALMALFD
ncbi:unnamed protein product [Aphanomyces euteiches]